MAAKKKLKLNIPLLRKIKKTILEEPQCYNQSEVVDFGAPGETSRWASQRFPACGTVGCIAGWAYVIAEKPDKKRQRHLGAIMKKAGKLLGLDNEQADILFVGDAKEWPAPFKARFAKVNTPKEKAKVAASFIDKVIETKGQILTDTYYSRYHNDDEEFPEESW